MGRASAGGGGPSKHGWDRNPQHPRPEARIVDKKHKRKASMKASKLASYVGGSTPHKPSKTTRIRKTRGALGFGQNEIEKNAYSTAARNVAKSRVRESD